MEKEAKEGRKEAKAKAKKVKIQSASAVVVGWQDKIKNRDIKLLRFHLPPVLSSCLLAFMGSREMGAKSRE